MNVGTQKFKVLNHCALAHVSLGSGSLRAGKWRMSTSLDGHKDGQGMATLPDVDSSKGKLDLRMWRDENQ